MGFFFRVGVIFAKKAKARKARKLPPRENFHVYSIHADFWKMHKYTFTYINTIIKQDSIP